VPNAAYRHFADRGQLLQAVCAAAMAQLALAMQAEQAAVAASADARATARERFRAVGTGCLRYAMDEPALFRTAFSSVEPHGDLRTRELVIDGPLGALEPAHVDRLGQRVLDMLDGGL